MAGRGKRKFAGDNGFEDWGGYMAAKISKLENQYSNELQDGQETNKLSNIFENIAIFVNGYTTPTAEELKRIMLSHGGTYHHYYNSRTTTHIVASNLCEAKIKKLKGDEKFVRPEWITDSVQAQTLLDFKPYLLYTGTVLDKGQQKLNLIKVPKETGEGTSKNCHEVENMDKTSETTSANSTLNASKNPREMKKAGEDNFLDEFYKRSRLHHISTMGAMFKRHVAELRESSDGTFPGMENLELWKKEKNCSGDYKCEETVFMHIDMDCFFVSVGLRNYPSLVGKPVVVTHARADSKPQQRRDGCNREFEFDCYKEHWIKKSRFGENNAEDAAPNVAELFPRLQDLDETCSMSEIASCSYAARQLGIYNGMFMGAALKLCPTLVAIPYDFEGYKEVSTSLYNTIASYTLDIEAVSCDELYADITTILRQSGLTPSEFATHLKEVIFSKTQCNASVGMGPNMLMARLATKKAKPNGLFYLNKKEMADFMKGHKVEDLPGVGRSMAHRLHALGVKTCLDLQQVSVSKLQQEFGQKQGQTLFNMCRGEDKRSLKTDHVRKSISADINYGVRFGNDQEMYKFVQDLSMEVSKRMDEIHVRGRLLTLKLKIRAKDAPVETAKFMGHGVCDSISRSTALAVPTRDPKVIDKEIMLLLRQLKVDCVELRGMGIQLSKLVPDNLAKGKQPIQNSLLNFVARSKTALPEESIPTLEPPEENIPTTEDQTKSDQVSLFELPSASQIDPDVFNQLPDELKNDIVQEYKRKGLEPNVLKIAPVAQESLGSEAGPSRHVTTRETSALQSTTPVTYDGIEEVADIDASYWSALPDDIKAEIERDIQIRKAESTSPTKAWKDIFKGKQSPVKATLKTGKRKVKAQEVTKSKVRQNNPIHQKEVVSRNESNRTPAEEVKEELSLSGASSLPEIRELLTEWFSSSDFPEEEDCDAVSNFLAKLVSNKELHKIEPIILFMKRKLDGKNYLWKQGIDDIVNKVQLHVIQYYNAPLKLPP